MSKKKPVRKPKDKKIQITFFDILKEARIAYGQQDCLRDAETFYLHSTQVNILSAELHKFLQEKRKEIKAYLEKSGAEPKNPLLLEMSLDSIQRRSMSYILAEINSYAIWNRIVYKQSKLDGK